MASSETVRQQAIDWAVRAGDPAFADWDGFMLWLEADPSHARAYDLVAAAVAGGVGLAAEAPANDDTVDAEVVGRSRGRRMWFLSATVAALVVAVAGWSLQGQQRDLYNVQTATGETRTIRLEAGTQVQLAGGSKVLLDKEDTRFARVERGQALFTVRHDAARPFEVVVGNERLIDIGTVFDVQRDAGELSITVAEGAVQFDPDGADVRLSAGEALHRRAGSDTYSVGRVPTDQVGEWREGRLTFEAASLANIAAQLSRMTGIDYVVAEGAGGAISGSILLAPLLQDPAAIGPLLGVSVRREGKRWVIGAR